MNSTLPALSIIRVVVAGNAPLRTALHADPGLRIVAEADDLRALLPAAQRQQPAVVILDATVLGEAGLAEIARVRLATGGARVLIVSDDDPAMVRRAFLMGASGFLSRHAATEELGAAVRALARGHSFVVVGDAGAMNDVLRSPVGNPAAAVSSLSQRERQVLSYIARGHTNKQAAGMIGLSVKTVESYRARIMQKLQLRGRADLTSLAMESGMFEGGSGLPTGTGPKLKWEIA